MADPVDRPVARPQPAPDEERWWSDLVSVHLDRVHAFVLRRVHNPADAEDITGDVFARAWRWLQRGRPPHEVSAWLFRAARTGIAEHWRAAARERALVRRAAEGHGAGAGERAEPSRATQRALALLQRLPSRYRRVLELRFLEELDAAEAARRLGISRGNLRVLQYRALRAAARLGEGRDDGAD